MSKVHLQRIGEAAYDSLDTGSIPMLLANRWTNAVQKIARIPKQKLSTGVENVKAKISNKRGTLELSRSTNWTIKDDLRDMYRQAGSRTLPS